MSVICSDKTPRICDVEGGVITACSRDWAQNEGVAHGTNDCFGSLLCNICERFLARVFGIFWHSFMYLLGVRILYFLKGKRRLGLTERLLKLVLNV